MLAFEHSHQQNHFVQQPGWHSSIYESHPDPSMNSYNSFDSAPNVPSFPYSMFEDPSLYVDAPQDSFRYEMHRSVSFNGSLKPSSHHSAELPPSTLSSASGNSIPSASSSTVGSPYSGHTNTFSHQESWIHPNQGLGIGPTIVSHDSYIQGLVGGDLDVDLPFGSQEKIAEDYVGEYANISSPRKKPSSLFRGQISQSPVPLPSPLALSCSPETLTIDSILDQANSVSTSATTPKFQSSSRSFTSSPVSPVDHRRTQSSSSKAFKSPTTPASACPRKPRAVPRASYPATTASAVASLPDGHPSFRPEHSVIPQAPMPAYPHGGNFQNHFFAQSSGCFMPPLESSYPSLIQAPRNPFASYSEAPMYPTIPGPFHGMSPAASPVPSLHEQPYQQYQNSQFSPHMTYPNFQPQPSYVDRRGSISSFISKNSQGSPLSGSGEFDDEGHQKGRCPNPDCGRVFKDLKAHMLTHQLERPEKCPILTCEYNQKGFARKYDKNRHTLTHYKGTMVCGFCPGSGSAAEKSFNRADVFKRHLTSVHGVEQTAPNSRKRSPTGPTRRLTSYCEDATGKCSTCSATFTNAQEFYEHLDDCVLRVVQMEEPSEAINQRHMAEVAADEDVKETLERHMLSTETSINTEEENEDEDDEEEEDDDEDVSFGGRSGKGAIKANKPTTSARAVIGSNITKPGRTGRKGLTYSKGGVPLVGKGRKKRKHYPASWGMSADRMQMKKRVLCVYDGERRLWKDDLMMHNEFEVRMNLADGKSYVTDLDVETLKRAEALHNASEEEKGPWMQEEPPAFDLEGLMA